MGASGTDADTFILIKPGGKALPAVILSSTVWEWLHFRVFLSLLSVIPLVCITC